MRPNIYCFFSRLENTQWFVELEVAQNLHEMKNKTKQEMIFFEWTE